MSQASSCETKLNALLPLGRTGNALAQAAAPVDSSGEGRSVARPGRVMALRLVQLCHLCMPHRISEWLASVKFGVMMQRR